MLRSMPKKTLLILSIALFIAGTAALLQEYVDRHTEFETNYRARTILFSLNTLIPITPILLTLGIALTLHTERRSLKMRRLELLTGIALLAFCTMTGNSTRLSMGTSLLSFAPMDAAIFLLIIYFVEVERRLTRVGAYPFAFLLLVHLLDEAMIRHATNYWWWRSQHNLAGYYQATSVASGISIIQGMLLFCLAFLIPWLRGAYLGGSRVHTPGTMGTEDYTLFGSNFPFFVSYLAYAVYVLVFNAGIPVLQ